VRPIRRGEMIARARTWVDTPRPYSQEDEDPETGYRLDCSGYVSMIWHLDTPGLTTVELPDLCRRISADELRTGDAVMLGGPGTSGDAGHVMVFEAWDGPDRTRFWTYEQVSAGTRHHLTELPPSPPYLFYRYLVIQE
jgi:hypothetical protein